MKIVIIKYGDIESGKTISVPDDLAQSMIDKGQAKAFIEITETEDVKINKRSRNKGTSTNLDTSEELVESNEE